jgi:2-keto-4-pentenoate hydratase/2-oxohepta-3-ene-1,7-dioic acid hydratase in catechol pathway|tara:strand:+ start:342 stop:1202 length:861 start_codon:yes stop_codon:yes gene_type:complete
MSNKFVSIKIDNKNLYGVETNEGVIELSNKFSEWPSLFEVVKNNGFEKLINSINGNEVIHPIGSYIYNIPISNPEKIICVGINYPDRNEEYKDGQNTPQNMSLFVRFPRSFVGHNSPIIRPKISDQLDYEGEVAIVIGKSGRHITEEQAYEHISAITICNEGTIRDWVRHAKFNVTQGKNFEKSGAMGPHLIPFSDKSQLEDISLITKVNDEIRQDDRTSRMLFNIPKQINYISTFTTLMPGDIIVTGTPTGAGARFDPPKFLKPGDKIEVVVEGVGSLLNIVEDE